jgi:cytochrome c
MTLNPWVARGVARLSIIVGVEPVFADEYVAKGEQVLKKCIARHGMTHPRNKVGSHLVGIVGRPIANVRDYKYSEDMRAYAATAGLWDEEKLNVSRENPRAVVAKTKMAFPGLKKEDECKDRIAYLKTIQ